MSEHKALAIITARGGSKGLPRKNVLTLGGKPLIAHTIEAALNCPLIEGCYVSTEDEEIKRVSLDYGAEVIDRPEELATDTAKSNGPVRHVLDSLAGRDGAPEYFALLQPTSPLRTAKHLEECLREFFVSGAACAVSVTEQEHSPYKSFSLNGDGFLKPLFDEESLDQPRQKLPKVFRQNGAIYVMSVELFKERDSFYAPPAMPYVMEPGESIDIDTSADLDHAESLLRKRQNG